MDRYVLAPFSTLAKLGSNTASTCLLGILVVSRYFS